LLTLVNKEFGNTAVLCLFMLVHSAINNVNSQLLTNINKEVQFIIRPSSCNETLLESVAKTIYNDSF